MPKSLLIVESPSKAKTINRYLGSDFIVFATSGHIKNLPSFKLGVDIKNKFEPEYVIIEGKNKIIKQLRDKAEKSDKIYIATDPDREGEAIAYHVSEEITNSEKKQIYRVLFNEITKNAIQSGIKNPKSINMDLVESQKARRILDRLVGFMVSPFLWKVLYKGLSAGRVQSVALRLLCEREKEILDFKSEEYWTITAKLKDETENIFEANLAEIEGKKAKISDKKETDQIIEEAKEQKFTVKKVSKKDIKRKPAPPFITSTLQQEAVRRFGMTTKKVMAIAQRLYEGVEIGKEGSTGLVTYIRTDSVRVSKDASKSVRSYIISKYGENMLSPSVRTYKNKKRSQDAHEAIRPTHFDKPPESVKKFLSRDEFRLYELIWNRFVATQMKDAISAQISCDIEAGKYLFRCTDTVLKFKGFLEAFSDYKENGKDKKKKEYKIPVGLKKGDILELLDLAGKQHFTQPPPRYNESTLVKELEAKNIGRPSTYSIIISTLLGRKYVQKDKRALVPTDLGMDVNKILVENLPELFNVKFTAQMESELDQIESGEKDSVKVIQDFYYPFDKSMKKLNERKSEIKKKVEEKVDMKCEKCGSPMVLKWGRNGRFYACGAFPKCKNTKPYKTEEPKKSGQKCDKCGSEMLIKKGRYGEFLACSDFPNCKNTKPLSIAKCPVKGCNGEIIPRRGKKRMFYGCTNYPECDFTSQFKIVDKICEKCSNNYLEIRYNKNRFAYLRCPKCKSNYKMNE